MLSTWTMQGLEHMIRFIECIKCLDKTVLPLFRNPFTAVGYNAKDVDKYFGFKTRVRELFARAKLFVDFLFSKEPKYLGEPIAIK